MREYLARQRHWLTVERLPGYAPDVNPVESVFGYVKGHDLANHCGPALATLATALPRERARSRSPPTAAQPMPSSVGPA